MRFAICNETFQGWEWARTCEFTAQCGYDEIEVAPFTLAEDIRTVSSETRAQLRRTAESFGLPIVALHWLLVSPKGLSVTSPDDSVRAHTSAYLVDLVDLCHDLGGSVMVFGSPGQRRVADGDTQAVAEARLCQSITPALDRAAHHGITICLEPLPAPEANLLLTLADARRLIERLDHPAARTIFDVKSAASEGADMMGLVREFAPYIAHVHANDPNRRGPGFGDLDFRPILRTLEEVGYSGTVSVEVFDYLPDPETIATQSLRYLRECLPQA